MVCLTLVFTYAKLFLICGSEILNYNMQYLEPPLPLNEVNVVASSYTVKITLIRVQMPLLTPTATKNCAVHDVMVSGLRYKGQTLPILENIILPRLCGLLM